VIPNLWYVVMDSSQVRDKPVGVTRMGEKLVFWRDGTGRVSCFHDKCVHRGVQLSKGKVIHGHLQCPFHGFEYELSGRVVRIPANGRNAPVHERFVVHSYPTYEAHDLIWIWWGENPPTDLKPPRFFDDIGEDFSYAKTCDHWQAHYSRVIENQLDVAHLPFVHHNTIGRGGRTLVDGPGMEWVSEDMFFVYFYNRLDDGAPPRKPEEVPVPDPNKDFKLEFIFPNLWQNHIGEKVRILAAFVPIDEENTSLYLRFYQKFIGAPLIRELVNRLAMPFNLLIAHQDRRVVVTQRPKASRLQIGEQLIQADRPIIEYRRRRQELMGKDEK
jgi:phenylpropionate dioxygenase-like ring-hydroxylating dioxygenase large terminal subunit